MADDTDLTRAFAQVIAEIESAGMSRKEIAAHIGVEPPTLSRYVTGERSVPVGILGVVDTLAGGPTGYVLMLAGFVERKVDTRTTLRTDRALEPGQRTALLKVYDGFVELAAARAGRRGADSA